MSKALKNHQKGLVSITVSLILMIIVTLLIFSFSLVSRREQRLALDRRLSSQAYYAAESGINQIKSDVMNGRALSNVTTCTATDVGVDNTIQNTCLLVDTSPGSLSLAGVGASSSKIIRLKTTSAGGAPAAVKRLEFYWNPVTPNTNSFSIRTNGVFPQTATFSVLRIALTSLALPSPFNRDDLAAKTLHAYLYPKDNGSGASLNVDFSNIPSSSQGLVAEGSCAVGRVPKTCKAVIDIPNGSTSDYLLKVSSIYQAVDLDIKAYDATTGGNELDFAGAQAIVDSTGRAGDVLRRIQARIPLDFSWSSDTWSVSENQICKQYEISGSASSVGGCFSEVP